MDIIIFAMGERFPFFIASFHFALGFVNVRAIINDSPRLSSPMQTRSRLAVCRPAAQRDDKLLRQRNKGDDKDSRDRSKCCVNASLLRSAAEVGALRPISGDQSSRQMATNSPIDSGAASYLSANERIMKCENVMLEMVIRPLV